MFCSKCGAENKEGAAFCNSCGERLQQTPIPDDRVKSRHNEIIDAKIATKEDQIAGISQVGPTITVIFGILVCITIVGIIPGLIIVGAGVWWSSSRENEKKKLRNEITELKLELIPDPEEKPAIILEPKNTVIVPEVQVSTEPAFVPVPAPSPADKRKIIVWSLVVVGIVVVLIVGAVFTWNHQDWNTYCSKNYPGSTYNSATNQCENPSGTQASSVSQSSSLNGDQAAIKKMSEMNDWMLPTVSVIGDSLTSGAYSKAGINAALLRNYIDQNLPTMQQLANDATTKKAAAQEYVLYLNDVRSASNKVVQAVDKYNAGDYDGSTSIVTSGMTDLDNAKVHLTKSMALL
ncbi:MAG TPA: DUF5362 family protein [Methanoregula sp.]|nr:DUF5362 family protein [Methanoregula sp.]